MIYEVNIRNYTQEGTFSAFSEHLPRLKDLGVDILWLMPIHPISEEKRIGTLGSWYSVADYYAVNPEYGTAEDFRDLVEAAHDLGLKVILDLVANHTGWDHPWITEHKDWYTQDNSGNIIIPPGTTWNDVADLNYDNETMRQEMIKVMKYWVTEFDIDGYRADYAGGVPQTFWEEATEELTAIKPLFMLAENDADYGLLDQAFNANYSFELMNVLSSIAAGTDDANRVQMFVNQNKYRYPVGTFPMIYTSNHDVNAWVGTDSEIFGDSASAMNVLLFSLPGLPLIYSGQEVNLDRRLAFFEKDEIDWTGWETNPAYLFYEQLIALKKHNPALGHDDLTNLEFLYDGNLNTLVYVRETEGNLVIVILNLSNQSQTLTLDLAGRAGDYLNYFTNVTGPIDGVEEFTLSPWEYRVYIKT
ncbi:MAG TPA: alpha-amylase [Acholeplasmatales bacterium]|nr:alpha-amylase [Acholeplasmatales bacterium]